MSGNLRNGDAKQVANIIQRDVMNRSARKSTKTGMPSPPGVADFSTDRAR